MSKHPLCALNLTLCPFEKRKGNENIAYKWPYYVILSDYCFIKERTIILKHVTLGKLWRIYLMLIHISDLKIWRNYYGLPLMLQDLLLCKSRSCFFPEALSEHKVPALTDWCCEYICMLSTLRNLIEHKKENHLRASNLIRKIRSMS